MCSGQKILLYRISSIVLALAALGGCSSRRLGWGVLLWSIEEPPILSGTVLPVYVKSNINKVWVVGMPEGWYTGKGGNDKIEIPFSRFEMVGSKKKADIRAQAFSGYALMYAENLQDGLPVRDAPDNNARRIYRMRAGEVIKILSEEEGSPAIGSSGDPLPGEWYKVLTDDGSTGYCFSYRLRLFEHRGGQFTASAPPSASEKTEDPVLDALLSKTWSPETYLTMVNFNRINLEDMSRHWRFDPGQDTGLARIFVSGIDNTYTYTRIRPDGARTWRFEGTNLSMQLRAETTLAVQFLEGGGSVRTLLFVALPVSVDDLIMQETARRERLYNEIYSQGPIFTSNNYGTITFKEAAPLSGSAHAGGGLFSWRNFDLLVPRFIPENIEGDGTILIDLFLDPSLEDRYDGAFTLRFTNTKIALRCMYSLDNEGFRIEIVPESSVEEVTIMRRGASPMVLYFFRDTEFW